MEMDVHFGTIGNYDGDLCGITCNLTAVLGMRLFRAIGKKKKVKVLWNSSGGECGLESALLDRIPSCKLR